MLPEILDSRHNRHMPIRNLRDIMEAKEKAAKKLCRTSRRNVTECENGMEESKRFKPNVSSKEVTMTDTVTIVSNKEQDNDCIIISHSSSKRDITEDVMIKHKKFLDHTFASLSSVKNNVLPITSELNDESLDLFLRIVRKLLLSKHKVCYI